MTTNQTTTNTMPDMEVININGITSYQFTVDKYLVLYIEGNNYYSICNMVSVSLKYKAIPQTNGKQLSNLYEVYSEVMENVKRAKEMNISATRLGIPYVK